MVFYMVKNAQIDTKNSPRRDPSGACLQAAKSRAGEPNRLPDSSTRLAALTREEGKKCELYMLLISVI